MKMALPAGRAACRTACRIAWRMGLCCLALIYLALIFSCPGTALAGTRRKPTPMKIYVGETLLLEKEEEILAWKISDESVLAAEREEGAPGRMILHAGKHGSVKAYFVTASGADWYRITVEEPSFRIRVVPMTKDAALITIKNNTDQTFEALKLAYQLVGMDGTVLAEGERITGASIAGRTIYLSVALEDPSAVDAKASQKQLHVTPYSRLLQYTYTDRSQDVRKKITDQVTGGTKRIQVQVENPTEELVFATAFVRFYNAQDKLTSLVVRRFSVGAEGSNSFRVQAGTLQDPDYDHYSVYLTGYSKHYQK